ncbi:MAG: hypothetical protein V7641_2817 [Blastocatellia bacterium]
MPSALIIPGVQVRTIFEPSPVLPGATGILGVVGITDRGPLQPTQVGNFNEFLEVFGAASRYSMPEVRRAFANGVSRVVIARTDPGRGQKAALELTDDDGETVATLEARAEGKWGNRLAVRVQQVKSLSGQGVKFVNLDVLSEGTVIESFNNLITDEESPNYFFNVINSQSRVLIAIDPLFLKGLPKAVAVAELADADSRPAFANLKAGNTDVIHAQAKRAGRSGNQAAVRVRDGQAGLTLTGANNAASVDIRARAAGLDGTSIRLSVTSAGPDSVNVVVTPAQGVARIRGPFNSVDALVNDLASDPDVEALANGAALPTPMQATPLKRRVDVSVISEGRDTGLYTGLEEVAAIAAINDPVVAFTAINNATQLPTANDGINLTGGRNKGAALPLPGDVSDEPLIELVPAQGARGKLSVTVSRGTSSIDNRTAVATLDVFVNAELTETFTNVTMDPDDPNYLPEVLRSSTVVRALDLMTRSKTTSLPSHLPRAKPLTGGVSPLPDDYQDALDRLESDESVDLVIASAAAQLDDAGIRTVHQAVVAHCTKMADVARNRIGIGSVTAAESNNINAILDHANDVRSDHFILTAPAGMEGAMAGLLGLQDFFQSPTFKTVSAPGVPPGTYTDAQLEKLIQGNVAVINSRRNLGNIVVKGLLTSGRQINVQRTANKSVREVKAISDKYIGLLNNEGTRNALLQQIVAMFLQMQRDGAIVPSVDGKDPAFGVNVYSTQADFANGIVRIDIAVRPVRAIDYIYATILVKN